MLDAEHLDAVFVCTPPTLHVDPAVASLERGLAVYLEKPLARSLADGRRIVEAWEASAAVCAVGYQWRSLDVVSRAARAPSRRRARHARQPELRAHRERPGRSPGGRGRRRRVVVRRSATAAAASCSSSAATTSTSSSRSPGPSSRCRRRRRPGTWRSPAPRAAGLHDAIVLTLRFAGGRTRQRARRAGPRRRSRRSTRSTCSPPDVALQLDLDPDFRLHGHAHGEAVEAVASADPRESTIDRFLDAVRDGDRAARRRARPRMRSARSRSRSPASSRSRPAGRRVDGLQLARDQRQPAGRVGLDAPERAGALIGVDVRRPPSPSRTASSRRRCSWSRAGRA